MILLAIVASPLVAAAISALNLPRRIAPVLTALASVVALALVVIAAAQILDEGRVVAVTGWVEADALSALVLLVVAWVAALAALYSIGYIGAHAGEPGRRRVYYINLNLFIAALLAVPVCAEPALAWIAIEGTAVFSVLLVAHDGTPEALEAAWKYIALMFMGATIALLGFLILFRAEHAVGGAFTWTGLRAAAGMAPPLVTAAFVLVLVGFGTKAGFVPLHTWLPDAHSQAPSPACALLSGVKTTTALYCILRLVPLLDPVAARWWLEIVGLVSVGAAALLLQQVRDYKRMFAYSTVEHMGIVFVAVGLGAASRGAGLLQLVAHALTKSFCFFAAGAVLLAVFVVIAFFGILRRANAMTFGADPAEPPLHAPLPRTVRLVLALGAVPVLVLGVWVPHPLASLLARAAGERTR